VEVIPVEILTEHKRKIFHSDNNQPLEESPQGGGGFPNIGHF